MAKGQLERCLQDVPTKFHENLYFVLYQRQTSRTGLEGVASSELPLFKKGLIIIASHFYQLCYNIK